MCVCVCVCARECAPGIFAILRHNTYKNNDMNRS